MSFRRAIIFSGGALSPDDWSEIGEGDLIIGADRGALYLVEHGIRPDIAVGDFDSILPEQKQQVEAYSSRILSCDPVHKDLTDTELALELAIGEQIGEVLLLGATGTRMDHTLANLQMLLRAMQHHIHCVIQDAHNRIMLTGTEAVVEDRGYTYISLLPMTTEVTGINLEGFMYPLVNATLKMGQSRGVSNRLVAPSGKVSIESGMLLIIQSRD
ncbi:thiamine diphosphokinase [Paenibacillus sp. P96]|uniref:Thiamine diphosphokinase n=1 Tax=Paenibacillus zeirhizosphaerae TaxID=2987519 RepID=A0ABT9FVX6_9BACL|nr:thiamine diphosphokinase [Paenibacillus sp. P96]MDP4098637.1 thiamine diphosphokinase [Paenibacillus sp. P96]